MLPIAEAIRLLAFGFLFILLCIASISDVKHRRIPNWTVLAIAGLFVPWAMAGATDSIRSSLEAALIALLLSGAMYAFGLLGAGDSKLLAVCGLFVGLAHLLEFFLLMALAGGVMAIAVLAMRPTRAMVMFQTRGLRGSESGIPYGVAIAIAAIGVVGLPVVQTIISPA